MQVARPLAHDALVERLWRAARGGRLPHALLFEGPAGIGKFEAAKWLAMGCLCREGPGVPCGACGPCRRVASGGPRGNHADLLVIDAVLDGEERIRVGRIAARSEGAEDESPEASLAEFLALKPLEGSWRVVLIRESERMNPYAQNALLKTLEEPRPGTLLVLETQRPAALLATIKSRCVRLRFPPLAREDCESVLATLGLAPEEARELARLSGGSPGVALAMARNGTRAMRAHLAAAALGQRDALAVAGELWDVEGEFAGKSETAQQRERCRAALDLALALVRDAWRAAAGVPPESLAHGDLAPALAARTGARELARRGERLAETRADVEHNLAPGALLERALLVLADGAPRSGGVGGG